MEFTVAFDMRAPSFGAPAGRLYDAALDMCAWADELGFDTVGIGEHHSSASPMMERTLVLPTPGS